MMLTAIGLAVRALRRNALRSFLTILGVVIGVGAVIALVTLGGGISNQVVSSISGLGSNLLEVIPGQLARAGGMTAKQFTLRDVEAIETQVGGIEFVVPISMRVVRAVQGSTNWNTPLHGTDNGFFEAMHRTFAQGRPFSDTELRNGAPVCVLGDTVRERLFGGADPIGETVRLDRLGCRVIGVMAPKGSALGEDQDDAIVMPIRTFQRRVAGDDKVLAILLSADEGVPTARVQRDVEFLLRERRHIADGEEDDFSVLDVTEIGQALATTTTLLTGFLSAIAAVSLLVGGIGIMNIMLVSVTERTREIGIRLAIGASAGQVLAQFLVESMVLSTFGGILGVAAGLGLAFGAARALDVPFVVDPAVVALAFGFSAAVGMIFGFLPARRAANLNPIEALRHE